MPEKTAEDRRHDVYMALLAFLLTTLAGGTLTAMFQWLQANRTRDDDRRMEAAKLVEEHRAQATVLFADVSEILDTRLYKWRQVAWVLENKVPEGDLAKKYTDYPQTILDWVYHLNKRRALLCRFFGPSVGFDFESKIMPGFNDLHRIVTDEFRLSPSKRRTWQPDELNARADALNNTVYVFNNRLAEAIRRGDVGSIDPGAACEYKDSVRSNPR